ncbi:hypothetical protein T11_8640 [Trichinella zimbabwensis]|uniref:Uncharacterized protein n=1 Tax=Trichinella zimbabwensis TaxID=268475 RepID=A0A0V1GHF3_9BILA|nr:hypothetical protein T11_8640 [Trichinella zimbabwensis]
MSKVPNMQKVAVSGSAERELLMGNFPMTVSGETLKNTIIYQYKSIAIKKSPNFEKNIFADFRKTSKSIVHEILKFSRKIL